MSPIEVKTERRGWRQLTITVTVASVRCGCGFLVPLPLVPAGRYALQCPACNAWHSVEIDPPATEAAS